MSTADYAYRTIRDLGRLLRTGEATPTALAEYFLERLDTVGRELNAVVTLTRERALREARLAEDELRAGHDRGPLHGIPYGAKDLLATANLPTTWGAAPLRDQVFPEDATAVARLSAAGAILVGKLGMVEIAGGMGYDQPNASITGPGINPWNRDAWSGGSSSGSGSAVGIGGVPFALGTETWGSIVTPASYCGISGLRPTYGRVSRHGAMALCWTLDKIGPMAQTADDCGLILDAIAGPDPADPTTIPFPYRDRPKARRTSGFRIGVIREATDALQPEVRASFDAALDALGEIGTLDELILPDLPYLEATRIILLAEAASAMEDRIEDGTFAGLTAPEDRIGGYAGTLIPAVDYLRAQRVRAHACRALGDLFGSYDAVVAPSTSVVASPLDQTFDAYAGKLRRTTLSAAGNLAGLPAVSVPNGFGERGLPTGLQFVGRAGAESAILAVARAYQARTHWHELYPPERGRDDDMNGAHDLGGMHGFGEIRPEADEPAFHEEWEGLVFAIVQASRALGRYNIDESRYGIERMDPARYLAASYYEKWLASAEINLTEHGFVSPADLDARTEFLRNHPDAPRPTRTDPDLMERVRAGQPHDWPARRDPARERFAVGASVVARNVHPVGHTRLPRYVRGKRGTIAAVRGLQVLPDANAHGRVAPPETVYSVQFDARELWGDSAEPGQVLSIDLWESYLEESTETR